MAKRSFTGASAGRRGYSGGFSTGGVTPTEFLGVVPDQPSMLLLVGDKGDWCIRSDLNTVFVVINVPSSIIGNWQQLAYPVDPSKVLSDAADPTPGYLNAKVENETLLVDVLRHCLMLRSVAVEVLALWDNTVSLPPAPSPGDRYAAKVTGSGWSVGYIYEWNGSAWITRKIAADGTIIMTYTGTVLSYFYYQTEWYILMAGWSNEIEQLLAKAIPTTADLLLIEDAATFFRKRKITIGSLLAQTPRYIIFADQLLSPNNADWTVNANAPSSADSLNNSLTVRQFSDAAEQGVGFNIDLPAGATNIIFNFKSRAETAPGAAAQITPRLYMREIVDNTAVGAWSAAYAMTNIDLPTNTRFQYDSQSIALATLGLTAGRLVQFELTRATGGLTGLWNLLEIKINFS